MFSLFSAWLELKNIVDKPTVICHVTAQQYEFVRGGQLSDSILFLCLEDVTQ